MYIYICEYILTYIYIYIYIYVHICACEYTYIHRETMCLERGVYVYHTMTPPPNFGHFCVILEGWSQILPSTKLFRHGFEQSYIAMATQNLEEKVHQHDEVVESSKTGCRSQSRAHGKAWASACTDLRQLCPSHLVRSCHLGGLFCS